MAETTSDNMPALDYLAHKRTSDPAAANAFENFLIGWLSGEVSDEAWRRAVDAAAEHVAAVRA